MSSMARHKHNTVNYPKLEMKRVRERYSVFLCYSPVCECISVARKRQQQPVRFDQLNGRERARGRERKREGGKRWREGKRWKKGARIGEREGGRPKKGVEKKGGEAH